MALPGDPSGSITYQITDLGNGLFRLRRRIVNGTQYRILDVTSDCRPLLELYQEQAVAAEGATIL